MRQHTRHRAAGKMTCGKTGLQRPYVAEAWVHPLAVHNLCRRTPTKSKAASCCSGRGAKSSGTPACCRVSRAIVAVGLPPTTPVHAVSTCLTRELTHKKLTQGVAKPI